MENLKRLRGFFENDARSIKILESIKNDQSVRILCSGLVGAMDSFVLSSVQSLSKRCHLYIATDKEEAAYVFNNLENILQKNVVHFFPDSFRYPLNYEAINRINVLRRAETINKISFHHEGQIVVTYPEALFEKVVSPKHLKNTRIEMTSGESIDIDFIIDVLVEYGFERIDFVYEPGQFSIRGGIVDIFSYGNEWPYRIELLDEEVESIRLFDPVNQLSRQSIGKVSIVPDINRHFGHEQKQSLVDILPASSLIWIKDLGYLLDQLLKCFEKAEEFSKSLIDQSDESLANILKDRAFVYPKDIAAELENHSIVLLRESPEIGTPHDLILRYEAKPQPSFNKNFPMLIESLTTNEAQGFENFIFSESSRQIERFYSIFEDLEANLHFHPILAGLSQGFIDMDLKIACYTDHQIFQRFHRYRLRKGFTREQAIGLKMLRELQPGDFVTHIDHGVGRYSGLEKINIAGHVQESVRLFYRNNDVLYVSINSLHKISKYVGKDGTPPQLDKIGGEAWNALKRKTKRKVKDIAKELIKLYAQRKASKGFQFAPDNYLQNELEASFIYEDTPDQNQSTQDVKEDMEKPYPMDRLICGDVGFGKTEVAIRAAFKAVANGKQVAILVPTTILALQHYRTFRERLDEFGIKIDYLNRFRSSAEKRVITRKIKEGEIEIIIGTHALLNKAIEFMDLGLLVIDEEQKFGVSSKEKLRRIKVNVDTLTLTATPIPRTLQFSLMAARDLSIIRTPPPNRQPIHTERRIFNDDLIREAIYYEVNRGGQVFFVHNRVKTLPDVTSLIRRLCPDIEVAMAHGQMDARLLEKTLVDFIDGRYDVLTCTNIIETGLDIPNANTIIVNNAHHFGLSDLHQLRGRVGRSNRRAFCYLFTPPVSVLTPEARKRLKTVEEFSDLGSGFEIAMRDLDIRGAGNLLGAEQSGFISEIGYETYQKILEEAIHELKEQDFKDLFQDELAKQKLFVREVTIETDIEMLIPDDYVNQIQERMNLYTELDNILDEDQLIDFENRLEDRFGRVPDQVKELFNGLRLRWLCREMGFERLVLKQNTMRCYFISKQNSSFFESNIFRRLLQFLSKDGNQSGWMLKQSRKYLILSKGNIYSLTAARKMLGEVLQKIELAENV